MPGLNSILDTITSLQKVELGLLDGTYIKKAVEEKKEDIVEMNVSQLYDEGVNRLGIAISTYAPYAPRTIQLKTKKGQPTDRVTLRDTGAFHKSFTLEIGPVGFYITATDYKTQELVDKYGANIFGLTSDNLAALSYELFPLVMQQIDKEIFK